MNPKISPHSVLYRCMLTLPWMLALCLPASVIAQSLEAGAPVMISNKPDGNIKQEFRLTAEELKAFEGYYQFQQNPEAHLRIRVHGDGLLAKQLWDYKEFFLLPKSALSFYSAQEKFPVEFTVDNKGKVNQALVFNRDAWKKVDEYTPRKAMKLEQGKLREFEGRYTFQFEPGKGEYIDITAREDHLVLKENWSGNEIRFQPSGDLEFYNKDRAFPLKFTRDQAGKITQVLAFNRDRWTRVTE
jgi:hypothetical protein